MSVSWLEQDMPRYHPRRIVHLPLFALSTKSAFAAGLAYFLGAQLPRELADYAYYASLGAVTVILPAVSDSVREAARAITAIASGVGLAVLLQWISWANWLTVAIVIGLATALGGIRWFADQRTWIISAGLFVLTTAGPDPTPFLAGYLTQLPLGAAVGVLVNMLVMPPLPFHAVATTVENMRGALVGELRSIADLLGRPEMPDEGEWDERLRNLGPGREEMRAAARQARRAQEANIRAKRHRGSYETLMERAEGVERCSALIDVVGKVMLQGVQRTEWANNESLRSGTARALADVAEVLDHSPPAATPPPGESESADELTALVQTAELSIEQLLEEVDATEFNDRESRYVAGSVALAARRCLETFTAPEQDTESQLD